MQKVLEKILGGISFSINYLDILNKSRYIHILKVCTIYVQLYSFHFCHSVRNCNLLIIRIAIIHIFNVKNYSRSSYYCKLGLFQALRLSVRTLIISGLVIWSNTKAPNYPVEKQSIAIQIFARAPLQQSRVGIRNVSAIFQQSKIYCRHDNHKKMSFLGKCFIVHSRNFKTSVNHRESLHR